MKKIIVCDEYKCSYDIHQLTGIMIKDNLHYCVSVIIINKLLTNNVLRILIICRCILMQCLVKKLQMPLIPLFILKMAMHTTLVLC